MIAEIQTVLLLVFIGRLFYLYRRVKKIEDKINHLKNDQ